MNANGYRPWIGWIGLLIALMICAAIGMNSSIGEAPIAIALLHGLLLGIACLLVRYSPFPARSAAAGILAAAVMARLLLVPMDISGDVYRYAWEGMIQQQGHNPYVLPPEHETLRHLRTDWWPLMNHPDKTAIYPPVMLLLFRGFMALTKEPAHFKWLFIGFDLAALAVLLSILQAAGRRIEWAWLYALNPVVLLAFAGEAHLDSIMVFFALLAVRLYQGGWWRAMFVVAALAFQSKYMALILVPFLVRRDNGRHLPILAVTATLPFLFYGPIKETFSTLLMFGMEMRFNGSIHSALTLLLDDMRVASWCVMALLGLYLFGLRIAIRSPLESLPYAWAALIALSPTIHFWYLTWLIPFLCLVPIRGWMLLCGTVACSYGTIGYAHMTGEWIEFPWATAAMYIPVYGLLIADLIRARPATTVRDAAVKPVHTVGVVVPTLNEANHLPALLDDLGRQTQPPTHIVICDGGSTDATRAIAEERGVTFLRTQKGRGVQIVAGIARLRTDAVFIAHADMRLPSDTLSHIVDALNQTGRIGGAVGARFDSRTPFLLLIEAMNHLRARWFGLSFGDQGQFVRRDRLADIGGFPVLPLMEDVECSARLRSVERPLYLRGQLRVSSRRWQARNPWSHAALVIRLTRRFLLYRLRHGHAPETATFYSAYHAKD